jgi:hypothetical protein
MTHLGIATRREYQKMGAADRRRLAAHSYRGRRG